MKRFKFFSRLVLVIISILFLPTFIFCYNGLLFKPLSANVFEPRVGAIYEFNNEKLRLDIGNSIDLLGFNINDSSELRFGADFFTYTRLRAENHFKFPVETSDYFFGINSSFKGSLLNHDISARLRIAHISSHLVDGLSQEGKFAKNPFVYSKEFIDLVAAIQLKNFRIYAGSYFTFSKKPNDIDVLMPQLGFDYSYEIHHNLDIVLGYDFKLIGINGKSSGINSLQAGIKLNTSEHSGILLSTFFYDGKSIHGMFFRDNDSYFAIGFNIIFY
jgi:hypothetical protein